MLKMGGVMTNAATKNRLETARDIARSLSTTPQTVHNWHRAGVIPARVAVGRIIRFDRDEVLAALELRTKGGQEP